MPGAGAECTGGPSTRKILSDSRSATGTGSGGNYDAETYASNRFQAEENFKRQHDGTPHHIREVEEQTSESSSSSSSFSDMSLGDMGGYLGLFAVLFVLWLIIEYWMFIVPISLIVAILWYFGKD